MGSASRGVLRRDIAPGKGRADAATRARRDTAHDGRGRSTGGVKSRNHRAICAQHPGVLIDALLDPSRAPAVRRRLARALSACRSQQVADGLLLVAEDPLPELRAQCARSLLRIRRQRAEVRLDAERVFDLVRAELTYPAPDLRHVFTLLSLILPREPLQIAFKSLHSSDRRLRGTALEYLEGVLPPQIRQKLWPFLVRSRRDAAPRQKEEIVADLLRSNSSVTLLKLAGKMNQQELAGFSGV